MKSSAILALMVLVAGIAVAGCGGTVRTGAGKSALHEALSEQGVSLGPPAAPPGETGTPVDNVTVSLAGEPGAEAVEEEEILPTDAPPERETSAGGGGTAAPVESSSIDAAAGGDPAAGGIVPPGEGVSPAAGGTPPAQPAEIAPPKVAKAATGRRAVRDRGDRKPAPAPAESAPGEPYWARMREELSYRIEFLNVTMGYAKFTTMGRTVIDGREAYHLRVRAWTTSVLALIYPVNDTIDYFIDVRTLAPLRQDYTHQNRNEKDDIATYDQRTGVITWTYKATGAVRKKQEGDPLIFDPVTVAYLFRARDVSGEAQARNVYAGRKFWRIHAQPLGTERIDTGRGTVETLVIRPVIRRGGKVEDKGDLRMWVTNDDRRIPVRIYAKFRKIRVWTLVGELVPNA